jgi:hypothetical protein
MKLFAVGWMRKDKEGNISKITQECDKNVSKDK